MQGFQFKDFFLLVNLLDGLKTADFPVDVFQDRLTVPPGDYPGLGLGAEQQLVNLG